MAPKSLNVFQKVLYLSFASNLVSGCKDTQESLQRKLQDGLIPALLVLGRRWRVVFGPVVWKNDPEGTDTGPENSWFVAHHPSLQFEDGSVHPTYVVSLASTPSKSGSAWTKEDFPVDSVSDFNAWVKKGIQNPPVPVVVPVKSIVSSTPYIATGTVNAAHLLLTTPAPAGAASEGMTLLNFISNLNAPGGTRFIFTGHSLGGALSPAIALALVKSGVIPAGSTLTYPTAGPSPGDTAFTHLFVETFPASEPIGESSYMRWNLNLVNTLDIVPQAWCAIPMICSKQNLHNIPPIYGKPEIKSVRIATIALAAHSLSSGVQYKPLPSQYFTGPPPDAVPAELKEFAKTSKEQHCQPYADEVGIDIPSLNGSQVPGAKLTEKAGCEEQINYPVIAELEWALEHPEEAEKAIKMVKGTEEAQVCRSEIDCQ